MGKRTPWYKWRFRVTGIGLVLFLAWLAWTALWGEEGLVHYVQVVVAVPFALLAAWLAVLEWRYRKPQNMWPPEEKDQTEE